MNLTNAQEIIQYIKQSEKKTPVKVYLKGNLKDLKVDSSITTFLQEKTGVIFGDWKVIQPFLEKNQGKIEEYVIENDRSNSAIPLKDLKNVKARIEPGAFIREHVEIGDNAIIMMGAVINIGSIIGEGTMIDMNAIIGGRGTIGKNCHIGAGAVVAGVIEPPSATPVIIEDNVVVGANAVILEGVRVGKGSVIAAGAVVVDDVPENVVIAGIPGRILKTIDEQTRTKTEIVECLRKL